LVFCNQFEVAGSATHDAQRAGIADGWEFEIHPPEPLPGFLIKINIKN
jgi:hypothetical protein